jgi:hypothetical protein
MDNNIKQLEYIRSQLAWIKSKVELDNQLGLYDINKLGENMFMHILNDVYELNLKNANLVQENFPAIDLVDDINKIVIQVTSTTTPTKLRGTIEKFQNLTVYSDYKLQIFYIKDKPNFQKSTLEEFAKDNIRRDDILGIDDIINIVQSNPTKCETLYKTIQQRLDSISFKFNIDSYFEQLEPHLIDIHINKFEKYKSKFIDFIESEQKILEIYAVGGSGKSHLLRYFGNIETEYIPLIFTKTINIEEDLKKLDSSKKYLFIFDDIDRFLDQPILLNLLAYTLSKSNIKLILSYRTASKEAVKTIYRRFNNIRNQELEIIWEQDEIEMLVKFLSHNIKEEKATKLAYTFNNNPYLITQAIKGDIESIKEFSKKIIEDTKVALTDFNLNDKEIKDLLFHLSLLTPLSKNNDFDKNIINKLVDNKILRELVSQYRFNPDMIGDLYLANYVDENRDNFEKIVENNLKNFSDTVFTNLSYALVYNESDSLQTFIKKIINKWITNKEYKDEYLALINKIVYFAPKESFIYLEKATKHNNTINLESIEPIISKIIYAFKNNIPTEDLKIEHIIKYLTSETVINLPKPYYANQTLDSIFEKLVSPLDTMNFDMILKILKIMKSWIIEDSLNEKKIYLLIKAINKLLDSTFEITGYEGGNFYISYQSLDLQNTDILNLIQYTKNILLEILESKDIKILDEALDSIYSIGGYRLNDLPEESQKFYINIQKEVLLKCKKILEREVNIFTVKKIEDLAIDILRFSSIKNESLEILGMINRTDEYLFYKIIDNENDGSILDYQKFYDSCISQGNIEDWIYENLIFQIDKEKPTTDEWKIIESITIKYQKYDQYIELLNSLNMTSWNSSNILKKVFIKWVENDFFIEIARNYLSEIDNEIVKNLLKEVLYQKGFIPIILENITYETIQEDIQIYINSALINYNQESINILQRIIDISQEKNANYINWLISIVSRDMYFKIKNNIDLYTDFEPIIIQFLNWQLKYKLPVQSYITHHILYNNILPIDGISNEIKNILELIVRDEEIKIDEFKLKPIYEILGYGLNEVIEILYEKLISKTDDGTYRYHFTHYFGHYDFYEDLLIKSYINSHSDFRILVDKALKYCSTPIKIVEDENGKKHEFRIHLDYFLSHAITQEYIEQLFSELIKNNDIKTIQILYIIVPVSVTYLDIIVQNLNLLEDIVLEENLISYLKQVGKIKSSSRSYMQNSDLVLSEEALFQEIYNRIDSLYLQLKLKEELKYLKIQKRKEIEEDIAHLLDK